MASPQVRADDRAARAHARSTTLQVVPPLTAEAAARARRGRQRAPDERHPQAQRPVPPVHPGESDGAVPADLRADAGRRERRRARERGRRRACSRISRELAGSARHARRRADPADAAGRARGHGASTTASAGRSPCWPSRSPSRPRARRSIFLRRVREGWRVAALRPSRRRLTGWSSSPSCACSGVRLAASPSGSSLALAVGFLVLPAAETRSSGSRPRAWCSTRRLAARRRRAGRRGHARVARRAARRPDGLGRRGAAVAHAMGVPEETSRSVAPHLSAPPRAQRPGAPARRPRHRRSPTWSAIQADGPLPIIDIDADRADPGEAARLATAATDAIRAVASAHEAPRRRSRSSSTTRAR